MGGWTVFQRRLNGSLDFRRSWNVYKYGFGFKDREFWLGLEEIHRLAKSEKNVLRIDLADFEGNTAYSEYGTFFVGNESSDYQLTVANFSSKVWLMF